jgi:hypothetical protein
MWDALVQLVTIVAEYGGIAGVILCFWMVDRFFLVRDLRKVNDQIIALVVKSTEAHTKAAEVLRALKDSIDQLCSRV